MLYIVKYVQLLSTLNMLKKDARMQKYLDGLRTITIHLYMSELATLYLKKNSEELQICEKLATHDMKYLCKKLATLWPAK